MKYKYNKCNLFFYKINEAFNYFLDNVVSVSKAIIFNNKHNDDLLKDSSEEENDSDSDYEPKENSDSESDNESKEN